MTLFEIDSEIEKVSGDAYDEETGVILDDELFAQLDKLLMGREQKIENIGCYIKNLNAEAEALKQEKMAFAQRQKVAENKVESLKKYLAYALDGQKFSTAKVSMSFRKSQSVEFAEDFNIDTIPEEFVKVEKSAKKTELKKAIQSGKAFDGVWVEEKQNLIIK